MTPTPCANGCCKKSLSSISSAIDQGNTSGETEEVECVCRRKGKGVSKSLHHTDMVILYEHAYCYWYKSIQLLYD